METARFSYNQAHQLTLDNIHVLPSEHIELSELLQRVTAADIYAKVDTPSLDVSLKDGYAVQSAQVAAASPENPVKLQVTGQAAAGGRRVLPLEAGSAVRILSGAPLPPGADAIVAEEFSYREGEQVFITNHAEPGRNILPKGSDVERGQFLIPSGVILQPAHLGLLASAGLSQAEVVRQPQVAILATGDEVIAPGTPLQEGKLYASNLVTLAAWCVHLGMHVRTQVVPDDPGRIEEAIVSSISTQDAVLTSGGAWSGDRDLVFQVLEKLGWTEVYHRVKIGPGKAAGFGRLGGKPVFCLPGGPPSNYMAFLNLALPGLMKLAGRRQPGLPLIFARLAEDVRGQSDWAQFIQGRFEQRGDVTAFQPVKLSGRLQTMALAEGVLTIPEGQDHIAAGSMVPVKILALPEPSFSS